MRCVGSNTLAALGLIWVGAVGCGDDASSGGGGSAGATTSQAGTGGEAATGSTGSILCNPGDVVACYSGAAETEGKGTCKAGVRNCVPDGSGFGDCEGEVTPAVETCQTPEDDDCDGEINESGTGCVCAPDAETTCFSGPQPAAGVGACTLGTKKCNVQGTEYSSCVGDVLPAFESCGTQIDENCDGAVSCTGSGVWAKRFGDPDQQVGYELAVDALGDVAVVGIFRKDITFGGPLLHAPFGSDGFIAKLSASGTHLWSTQFGGIAAAYDVAFDSAGNVLVAGSANGPIVFQGVQLSGGTNQDVIVAKLGPDGMLQWAKRFGGPQDQEAHALAVDGSDNVIISGYFRGTIDFGGGPMSASTNQSFVAKLDPNGNHILSRTFVGENTGFALAVDSADNIIVAGAMSADSNFGGGLVTAADTNDGYVVKLTPSGTHLWSHGYVGQGGTQAWGVAVDPVDNVLLAGEATGDVDFGNGLVTTFGDAFLLWLDPAGGYLEAKIYGDAGASQAAQDVSVDAEGNILLTGHFSGTINFGGSTLTAQQVDGFLAKLGPNGSEIWSKAIAGSGVDVANAAAPDPFGNVFVTGSFPVTIDLGTGPLTGAGFDDVFVGKLAP